MKGRGAQTIVLPKNLVESNGAKNTLSEHGTLWLLLQGHRVVGSQLRPWLHSILFQSGCDQARTGEAKQVEARRGEYEQTPD
ncbi:hypothetical protein CCYS_00215 [Corynebacterium cystitidis DSM 20524]|nr:hypothetical protein CCYS_00215 [Corynebacterium cystitidis DSM 20524]SNV90580.1 Uncharacterised protein [Corynebacterium cystitidis]